MNLKGEVSQAKRDMGARMMRYRIFKIGLLHIHLCGRGLTVWWTVASYITTGSIVHVFPIIQSVIIRCMYAYNTYELLTDSWLSKVTWVHNCASRGHVPELEKPLWLVCIYSVPRTHEQELKTSLWLFLCDICELFCVCLGWALEITLYLFWLGHSSLLMPNFPPHRNQKSFPATHRRDINRESICPYSLGP